MLNGRQDWDALLNSEVFRNYAQLAGSALTTSDNQLDNVLAEFEELEVKIAANPQLVSTFQVLQKKFATDLAYRSQTDPNFVEAVMMLNLPDSEGKNA